jgi:hypothetical protein
MFTPCLSGSGTAAPLPEGRSRRGTAREFFPHPASEGFPPGMSRGLIFFPILRSIIFCKRFAGIVFSDSVFPYFDVINIFNLWNF